jgi:hypothetical protein
MGVYAPGPFFDRVVLTVKTPLIRNKVYTLSVAAITDCAGNPVGNKNSAKTGLGEIATQSDIVINEILFNPPPGGVDFVEIYNRSNKIIDLQHTFIANRSSSGTTGSVTALSAETRLLFPGEYIVVSENAGIIKASYIIRDMDAFIIPGAMPDFNDDEGVVIILNQQGVILDEIGYDEDWHFKLINNNEGVSLERIDFDAPGQSPGNWHSASTTSGYGTPTYRNSQYRLHDRMPGELTSSPAIVSPDGDGQDDFATLAYNFPEPGYVANITIFDAAGRPVRYLQRNALCGTTGTFRWDGLGSKNERLAVGIYVVFTEVFNLKGARKQFKHAIVLARRSQ